MSGTAIHIFDLVEFTSYNQGAENDFGRASLTKLEIFEDKKSHCIITVAFCFMVFGILC